MDSVLLKLVQRKYLFHLHQVKKVLFFQLFRLFLLYSEPIKLHVYLSAIFHESTSGACWFLQSDSHRRKEGSLQLSDSFRSVEIVLE